MCIEEIIIIEFISKLLESSNYKQLHDDAKSPVQYQYLYLYKGTMESKPQYKS